MKLDEKKTFSPPLGRELGTEIQYPAQKWSRYLYYTGRRMNIHGLLFKTPTDSRAYHHQHHRVIYIHIFIRETTAKIRPEKVKRE